MRRLIGLLTSLLAGASLAATESKQTKFSPASTGTGLMTQSTSPAAGMSMAAKFMPMDIWDQKGQHSVTTLRKNQSDAQFDLALGDLSQTSKSKAIETDLDASIMHIGLGTTIVTSSGIRFGAHMEIADDPIKVKVKEPVSSSSKVKASSQDLSFFAAAGITPNIGIGLNILMADRKISDNHESATMMSPGIMGMFDQTEAIFDLNQPDEDVGIDGHWRIAVVHNLGNDLFATGHLMRVQPYSGDDYWNLAGGARKKTSSMSSMGAEFLYSQQKDNDAGSCSIPALLGARGDLDYELNAKSLVSAGAQFNTGSCSDNGVDRHLTALQFKGALTLMF